MKQVFYLLVSLAMFSGCRSIKYVPVESVRTEYKDKIQRDSIYQLDSVRVYQLGDTVYFNKYKYIYRYNTVRDSVYIRDSIQVPFPVEKELTRWQKTKMDFGGWAMGVASGLLIIGIGYIVIWLTKKLKK
ncbi:hypothetical protein [Parabacteroides sp. Marseille-P3160]|uniref:hypothetical protein n=1 Tax=Parabacteroides sp. Marseille-P3160 TaxID=1917887 RepID=UPI0009BBA749|nr:hypothetical protein [Parabacteroides sp. Marseille-P3160]